MTVFISLFLSFVFDAGKTLGALPARDADRIAEILADRFDLIPANRAFPSIRAGADVRSVVALPAAAAATARFQPLAHDGFKIP